MSDTSNAPVKTVGEIAGARLVICGVHIHPSQIYSIVYDEEHSRVTIDSVYDAKIVELQFKAQGDAIKVGDVVKLKSGGPLMTVSKVGVAEPGAPRPCVGEVDCTWMDDSGKHSATFTCDSLCKTGEPPAKAPPRPEGGSSRSRVVV